MERRNTGPPRATIRDVARLAGVSVKTVSRVLNNEKYVQEATRDLVQKAMRQLDFQPSFAARALAGRLTHQIALICDNPNPWYVYEVIAGARARCARDGVRLLAQPYDRNADMLLEDIVSLVDQVNPDGIVLTPAACDDQRVLHELARRKVPVVRIQPGTEPQQTPSVSMDNGAAMHAMTQHLLELGHRRIGFLAGDRQFPVSEERRSGFLRAMKEAGLSIALDLMDQGDFRFGSGVEAGDRLLSLQEPPSAIVASNDEMAAGVLVAAHRRGIAVPEQLSVTGFDDAPIAQMTWPPLTTVHQPLRRLAEEAANLLLTASPPDASVAVEHHLALRDSTAPRRSR